MKAGVTRTRWWKVVMPLLIPRFGGNRFRAREWRLMRNLTPSCFLVLLAGASAFQCAPQPRNSCSTQLVI